MNTPYIKQLNEKGEVINLSKHNPYINHSPNRRERRLTNYKGEGIGRFRGNNKGNAIVVVGNQRYHKTVQRVPIFVDKVIIGFRTIYHSIVKSWKN